MAKYRKKPVEIEARQIRADNHYHIAQWCGGYVKDTTVIIPTLEGDMEGRINDYIIKGINGDFYPCKPDIFEQSYEEVK